MNLSMSLSVRLFCLMFALLMAFFPGEAQSESFSDAAKRIWKEQQSKPQSRCYLPIITGRSKNDVVVKIMTWADSDFPIRPGDVLLTMNGKRASTSEERSNALVAAGPQGLISVGIERSGKQLQFDLKCVDSAPYLKVLNEAILAASKAQWDKCVAATYAAERLVGKFAYGAGWRSQCFLQGQRRTAAWTGQWDTIGNARNTYDYWRTLMDEEIFVPNGLDALRADLLAAQQYLSSNGGESFAQDLVRYHNELLARENNQRQDSAGARSSIGDVATSYGSCFFVSPDGLAVTNFHVISGAKNIQIRQFRGSWIDATVETGSEATDIAILKVPTSGRSFLSLAPPRSVKSGDRVFTLGFPLPDILGDEPKFGEGTIGATTGLGGEPAFLQTSVALQPGSSGGPLVNQLGQVLGITTATTAILPFMRVSGGALPQDLNWAIKSEYISVLIDLPQRQVPSATRDQAISLVKAAACQVKATN